MNLAVNKTGKPEGIGGNRVSTNPNAHYLQQCI